MMKLQFQKNESKELSVKMQNGTVMEDFDYVHLIKQLVENNQIELECEGIEEVEKIKLQDLIEKIKKAVEDGMHVVAEE